MSSAPKYQQLRSEVGRKGIRVLADVNVRDLRLGLLQVAPNNRDAWLSEISGRMLAAMASNKDPRWHSADFRMSVYRAAAWLFDEREEIHARGKVAS